MPPRSASPRHTHAPAEPVEIKPWSKNIGADYLIKRTGRGDERAAAEELSEALGGLPLAHEQAASYCERLEVPLAEYHKRFYVMRQESGGWKVVDVLADGAISRVAAQRSEMRSMLADSGGAGLLVGLRQKTADLSGGILQ
jgi:hypothetical protein